MVKRTKSQKHKTTPHKRSRNTNPPPRRRSVSHKNAGAAGERVARAIQEAKATNSRSQRAGPSAHHSTGAMSPSKEDYKFYDAGSDSGEDSPLKAQPTHSMSDRLVGDIIDTTCGAVTKMVSSGLGMLLPNRYFKRKAKEMDKEHEASSARLMKSLDEERKRRAELEQEVTRLRSAAKTVAAASASAMAMPSAPGPPPPPPPPPIGGLPPPPPPPPPGLLGASKNKGAGKKGPYVPKGGIRLIDISGVKLRRNPNRACKKTSDDDAMAPISLQDLMSVSLKKTVRPVKKIDTPTAVQPPMMRKLRKSQIDRSPGGTPMRNKTNESEGEGLTPMLSRALKKKFQRAYEEEGSPSKDASDFSPTNTPQHRNAVTSSPLVIR